MSQTLSYVPVHIVFSTKHRLPTIDEAIQPELHSYLGAICSDLGCMPIRVGGVEDHVHVLCTLSRKVPIMKVVERLKSLSSAWIKRKSIRYADFYWQNGYAIFSVDHTGTHVPTEYIDNQKQHHQHTDFKSEFRELLTKSGMAWDERYIWD